MNIWKRLLQCSLESVEEEELLQFSKDRARGLIKPDALKYFCVEDFGSNSDVIIDSIRCLYSNLAGSDLNMNFLDQAMESGEIVIDAGSFIGRITCSHSFYFSNSNVLAFKSKAGLVFFVQIRKSLDAIIVPALGFALGRRLESVEKVCVGFVSALFKQVEKYAKYLLGRNVFGGLLVSNDLPYHYYYDDLPGFVNLLIRRREKFDLLDVYAYEGEAYFPIQALVGSSRPAIKLNPPRRGELSYVDGKFFISAVRNERQLGYKLIEDCDSHIRTAISRKAENLVSNDVITMDWKLPTLWLGILAGKRQWVEQTEAFITILDNDIYRGAINVIFDGMTVDSFSERSPSISHEEIIKDILCRISTIGINVLNLNGRSAADKLYAASKVDFFVTDAATSSIYVSRFFKKPGVCHSLARSRIKGHIHGDVYHLSDVAVDLQPNENWIYAKYSIDSVYFRKIFLQKAAGYLPLKVTE
ncbi:hypothetical protein [Stutzerimonas stutzeri]|uniref:hypothetical protein n=1 Tax=Stutzerimonas stutzeri TaxID=316 RepID=UPI000F7AF10E|nr:hypothetical protein [Stutzerimonas stutzeri]